MAKTMACTKCVGHFYFMVVACTIRVPFGYNKSVGREFLDAVISELSMEQSATGSRDFITMKLNWFVVYFRDMNGHRGK